MRLISISSGKGGVGKTTLAVNMGISLARQGRKVCLLDADTNLANINIMLRETPEFGFQDVLSGEKSIEDVIVHSQGLSFLPGASGITAFTATDKAERSRLLSSIHWLEKQYDIVLVDTSAGIHDRVIDFISFSRQCIIVITPEPTSLTDSFSLLRVLHKSKYNGSIRVVVNQALSEVNGRKVFKRFSDAIYKYIGLRADYLGYIDRDERVSSAVCSQVPIRVYRPDAVASRCFDTLSENLLQSLNEPSHELVTENQLQTPLADSVTSPVIVSQQAASSRDIKREERYRQADIVRKKQLMQDHKQAILDFIEDGDFSQQEIARTLDRFILRYFRTFNACPSDIVEQLELLIDSRALSDSEMTTIQSLLNENRPALYGVDKPAASADIVHIREHTQDTEVNLEDTEEKQDLRGLRTALGFAAKLAEQPYI